jgi:hypothetical protein
MIHRPMYMWGHKHAPLLQTIADEHIKAAPSVIHLYKVPAHAGLIGNERADQLAKEAAEEECDAREVCLVSADTPMHSMYWPTFLATMESPGIEAPAAPEASRQGWHLSDLSKSLKKHMHALHRSDWATQTWNQCTTRHGGASCPG